MEVCITNHISFEGHKPLHSNHCAVKCMGTVLAVHVHFHFRLNSPLKTFVLYPIVQHSIRNISQWMWEFEYGCEILIAFHPTWFHWNSPHAPIQTSDHMIWSSYYIAFFCGFLEFHYWIPSLFAVVILQLDSYN